MLRLGAGLFLVLAAVLANGVGADARGTTSSSGGLPSSAARMIADLAALSNHDLTRIAGMDTDLPAHTNGHDEFVAAWTARVLASLHGLPATVYRQPFTTPGYLNMTVKKKAENVIVTVPGSRDADKAVVLGCHPDGEPFSRGSAYDDASGCVEVLGVARTLGAQWRSHGLPYLTVEFDLFDAEEQGVFGSTAFLFAMEHGALMPRPVFMLDEEQIGVSYPVRPFGVATATALPLFAVTNNPNPIYAMPPPLVTSLHETLGPFVTTDPHALARSVRRTQRARAAAFHGLHAAYPRLQFRGGKRGAFAPSDLGKVEIGDAFGGGSDNQPFEALGIPTLTLVGDYTYYSKDRRDWSYPFDQPQDTLANLACDTGGSPTPSVALAAALDLGTAISASVVDAYAPPATGQSLSAFSSIPTAGARLTFAAVGHGPFVWRFGGGGASTGTVVHHTFSRPGTYAVSLQADGTLRKLSLTVPGTRTRFAPDAWVGTPPEIPWHPPELATTPGCP